MKIPLNLLMFWHQRDEIPASILGAIKNTLDRNKDFYVIFADDIDICQNIQTEFADDFFRLYRYNRIPASRSDLARLIQIYLYGGIYLDCSIEMLVPLHNLMTAQAELILIRRDDQSIYAGHPEKAHFINGILAATPRNPIILKALEISFAHLQSGKYNQNVWMATGANSLNLALNHYQNQFVRKIFNYSDLQGQYFVNRRDPLVSNTWVLTQEQGILPGNFLTQL